ncbi:MAG: tRNA lysidine(34) synthetase TilS [Pseudomonadota bacterium]
MAPFGPFEARPRLAVAVSGGSDSLGLCLLADAWARRRRGEVLALTVDHNLRPGSGEEAARVAGWLSDRGIDHRILAWQPHKTSQQAARDGRYRLLDDACCREGILHLLVGHTADDQAETVAFRHLRGSGQEGMSGIATVRELAQVRLLRPFLTVRRDSVRATLSAFGQPWIDDPSNLDDRYARARVRRRLGGRPSAPGLWFRRTAREGERREAAELELGATLARWVTIRPAGYAIVDRAVLNHRRAASLLGRIVRTVRGTAYAPSPSRLEPVCDALRAGVAGQTIGGCRIAVPGSPSGSLLIAREAARISAHQSVKAGETVRWDDRFIVSAPEDGYIAALGDRAANDALARLPAIARQGLPALWRDGEAVSLPEVAHWTRHRETGAPASFQVGFRPSVPLAGAAFARMFGVV